MQKQPLIALWCTAECNTGAECSGRSLYSVLLTSGIGPIKQKCSNQYRLSVIAPGQSCAPIWTCSMGR